MKKKITIGDIASELGISKTTVSFVLNGKARENHISVALEKKILKHIEKVGYRPNHFAQSLRTGKTKIIGMLIEDISDPFFASIARIVEEIAYSKGYKIFYSSTENDPQKTRDLLQVFRTRQVDGYIIAPPPGIEKELKELVDDGHPVVVFDRTLPGFKGDNVVADNYQGAFTAIQHFIDNGYQRIAMITLNSDQVQMIERQKGYNDAIKATGQLPIVKKVTYHDDKEHSIREIQDFIAGNGNIDAVFFATNYIADNGLEAIRNLNLSIPQELGVIVFDDYNLFRLFTPSITAISQPIKEMAERVINLMLERLSATAEPGEARSFVLSSTLMVRNSSLPKTHVPFLPQERVGGMIPKTRPS
ncbi:MAG: substrate-binding domain-containing protein [Mucilaginibacter sp.]|uniref:LacI family DNA-binding transcriptional regulator n=1 Tax=Mucilaginibacter sp. TaxID=1882438 RepID=UPI0032671A9A